MTPHPNDNIAAPPSKWSIPSTVKLLGWISFLNDVASEMIYTQVPAFLLDVLGGNKFYLGVIEGVAETTASLVKLWSGAKTDQTGRRKGMLVVGYALASLTRPLIGLVTAPWQLLVLRVGDRIGKGIRTSPRDALIADVTDETNRGRAFGFHRGMDHLGAAIGPLFATAYLLWWPGELRTLFFLTLLPGLAVMLLVLRLRERPAKPPQARQKLTLTLQPFGRDFRLFLIALLVFTLGNSSDMFLLVRAQEIGVPQAHLPLLWCLFHVAKSVGNMLVGPLVDRFGPRPLLMLGWIVYILVYSLFAFATMAWHAWAIFLAYAVYYALTEPAEKTLVANLVGPAKKGLAFGWFNLIVGIGALPASMLFGGIYWLAGAIAAFGTGAVLALVSLVLLATLRVRKPTDEP